MVGALTALDWICAFYNHCSHSHTDCGHAGQMTKLIPLASHNGPLKFPDLIGGNWYWCKMGENWACWYFQGERPGMDHAWEQTIFKDDGEYWDGSIFYGPINPPDETNLA